MPHADDLDQQSVVIDLVDNPVVPDAHTVDRIFARQRYAARRSGLIGKQIYGGSDALLIVTGQPSDQFDSPAGYLDLVATHTSRSVDLTSSQGT